jgi:hypothetical protein|tara:strand:- start:3694 stop:3924 length:231 start_codon:yes stop_codon:yes gene_type:complete
MQGIVKAFHKPTGKIVTPEKVYDFNVECVCGSIQNNQEVDFTINDNGCVVRIDGIGAEPVHEEPIQEELLLEEEEE